MLLAFGSSSGDYLMRVVCTILPVIDDSIGHILRIIAGVRSS